MPLAVPRYFDYLIEAFRSHNAGRHVHLGYWDDPPPLTAACSAQEFADAQARLTDVLIRMADLKAGQTVLDVGCGFGGTLEAAAKWPSMLLAGINIDRRQLDICRSAAIGGNALSLIMADACAFPFRSHSFDRIFCVEAMFHFRDRAAFLREAAGVLRDGGRLVISDILLRNPGTSAGVDVAAVAELIRSEYGPWPQPWMAVDALLDSARGAGLRPERVLDVTAQTLPTYRFTAPQPLGPTVGLQSAGDALRWLHSEGYLSYLCISFVKF
ncbi:MAG TPA: methyltransferase domain-containing protein [Xanthobacteraceae bacterium]|nr:methyltransferase domain-containing protein [Xanthobacteraceae bacterium]